MTSRTRRHIAGRTARRQVSLRCEGRNGTKVNSFKWNVSKKRTDGYINPRAVTRNNVIR